MECTTRVLRVMAPLRLYWDQRRLYYQEDVGGDADAVDRSVPAGEDATMDLLRKCTDAVNDPLFWSYAHMINSIGDDVRSPFNRWLLSCTCHPRLGTRPSSSMGMRFAKQTKVSKINEQF